MVSKPIPVELADAEIKEFIKLKQPFMNVICEMAKLLEAKEELVTFHSSKFNAFLFEKEDVLRFFDESKQQGKGKEAATHLMVVLGAHIKEESSSFKAGSPTVILAGVVPVDKTASSTGSGKGPYRTLKIDDPADEYPNQTVISHLPVPKLEGEGGSLFFTIE